MKKMVLSVFFIMLISTAEAENLFDVKWNFGNAGFGINYSSEHDDSIEFTVSVFNFTVEQKDINISMELNSIKYWYLFEFQNEPKTKHNGEKFSFINANICWDLIWNKNIVLGPFLSVNYVYVNTLTGINMNEYVFGLGLQFAYCLNADNHFNLKIINCEIGYRNIMGNNKFYFSINADIILALYSIGKAAWGGGYSR
jgi:hypothetical protein